MPRTSSKRALHAGFIVVALMLIGLGVLHLPVVTAAGLSSIRNVSRDANDSILPHAAQDPDGNIHVIWASTEGSRVIRYAKGTWNGNDYDFGTSSVLADVGGNQYATPTIAVSPAGTVLAVWSDGSLQVQQWNASANGPSGSAVNLGSGIQPSVAADSANRFHIVWNGDFQVQYCTWTGSGCQNRDAFARDESNRPDIAVDSNDAVHLVWDRGQGISYRARPANGGWGAIQDIGDGNFAQIAADRQGNVHLVWSRDFDIQYCRRTLSSGCADNHTFDVGDDIQPTVGATPEGKVVVAFRASNRILFAARENGNWSAPQTVASGVMVDLSPQPYTERVSLVWSLDFDIQHVSIVTGGPPAPSATPTPLPATPTPTPLPAPATGVFDFADPAFRDLWTRTDSLVKANAVNYSWIWGPVPFTQAVREYYVQSPGQSRLVQYYDKSRMEINQPGAQRGPFYVTNGRLADELITGVLQVGDAQYEQRSPAAVPVAGDPQNTFPLYRDLREVYRRSYGGDRANQELYRAPDGAVRTQPLVNANNDPSMLVAQRVNGLGIPSIFWDFLNRPGSAVENGATVTANPLFDWRYVVGEPLTEAYWVFIKVNGVDRGVLVQAFERRVLTFTPSNPAEFQVEMGNIGRHYFEWRYGVRPQ